MVVRSNSVADLIININIDESRKKKGLIIETYEGIIPHLKSKKYSGQLRNVDLSTIYSVDNISLSELEYIKSIFNNSKNLQINKFQYIFSVQNFPSIIKLLKFGCVFCKDRAKDPMFMVESVLFNSNQEEMKVIYDFSVLQKKTTLFINYDFDSDDECVDEIIPLLYIDITSPDYISDLYFDYGNELVKADDKDINLSKERKYRDYKFEKEIINLLSEHNWKLYDRKYYKYVGKDVYSDMRLLNQKGIRLFTNERKKISIAEFTNTSISYGIDWFEIKGEVHAGEFQFDLSKLIDFRKKKEDWTEYKGEIIFYPSEIKKFNKNVFEKSEERVRVTKNDIFSALEIIDYFDKDSISKYSISTNYQNVNINLSPHIAETLREYQKIGVKWLLSLYKNGFGGCLADDMGLGKTLQVIAYLSDKSLCETKALIVVPKTLIENWRREFAKFSPDVTTCIYHGNGRNIKEAIKSRIVITTYGTLLNDIEEISQYEFDHLIIDEAQNIKNSRSKAYRAIKIIKAKTRIIMTGTPLENNIQEFWGLMKIVNPTNLSYKTITSGLDDDKVVDKIRKITSPFILRRYKLDVLEDLPDKEEQTIYCELDEKQRQLYNNLLESIQYEINRKADRYEMKTNSFVLSGLLYLQESCCHPKLLPIEYNLSKCYESAKMERLISMIDELYLSGHKIVVFSRFTKMLDIIRKEVTKKHFNIFYLDGATNKRQEVVDEFEHSPEGVFLISLKAGGVGLNLVSADTAIIYDPWWNPAVEKQAEDRIYRIGQKNKVTVYKLIAADTIEEKVQNLQEIKRKLFDDIIEGHDIPKNITMDDIKMLING